MIKPPFKTKGIYFREVDAETELENAKSTKLGKIWNVMIGKKEDNFYDYIVFFNQYDDNTYSPEIIGYFADYYNMAGQITSLVNWQKNKGPSYNKFIVKVNENKFEFGNEKRKFYGSINEDIMNLTIQYYPSLKTYNYILRYLPWTF